MSEKRKEVQESEDARPAKRQKNSDRGAVRKYDGSQQFRLEFKEDGVWFEYIPALFDKKDADELLSKFIKEVPFKDEKSFYGNPPCRQVKWYGDFQYIYSKTSKHAADKAPGWISDMLTKTEACVSEMPRLEEDKKKEEKNKTSYSGVLLNLYRNGKDSISWHADDESMLELMAPVASLSFGSTRVFKLRHKFGRESTIHVRLRHGSLFVMGGRCQQFWLHAVEKEPNVTEPRVNATLRQYAFK